MIRRVDVYVDGSASGRARFVVAVNGIAAQDVVIDGDPTNGTKIPAVYRAILLALKSLKDGKYTKDFVRVNIPEVTVAMQLSGRWKVRGGAITQAQRVELLALAFQNIGWNWIEDRLNPAFIFIPKQGGHNGIEGQEKEEVA